MPEQDLGQALATLARHAGGAGRLDDAAAVRDRADRRRRRRHVGAGVFGVAVALALGAGIALAQPHGPGPVPPAVSPSPSGPLGRSASPSGPPPATGSVTPGPPEAVLFSARQAYRIVPVVDGHAIAAAVLTMTPDGHLEMGHDLAAGTLFTTPSLWGKGNAHMIRIDRKQTLRCLSVQGDDTLGVRDCLATDDSVWFRYYQTGSDDRGRTTYAIRFGLDSPGHGRDAYLVWDAAGPVVKARSGGPLPTTWAFVDAGRSTLPVR
jgi:hypothetical protein